MTDKQIACNIIDAMLAKPNKRFCRFKMAKLYETHERKIRSVIKEICVAEMKYPIVADSKDGGYYIAPNAEVGLAMVAMQYKKIKGTHRSIKALNAACKHRFGAQLKLL